MKRALLLFVAALVLGGCATYQSPGYGYGYREPVYRDGNYYYPSAGGQGDYYYAPPTTTVRYQGYGYGGWNAPYGGAWGVWGPTSYGPRYGTGLSLGFGHGFGGSGYWPYYGYPRSWSPRPVHPRPVHPPRRGDGDGGWRRPPRSDGAPGQHVRGPDSPRRPGQGEYRRRPSAPDAQAARDRQGGQWRRQAGGAERPNASAPRRTGPSPSMPPAAARGGAPASRPPVARPAAPAQRPSMRSAAPTSSPPNRGGARQVE